MADDARAVPRSRALQGLVRNPRSAALTARAAGRDAAGLRASAAHSRGMLRLPERIEDERIVLRRWRVSDAALLQQAVEESMEHLRPWMGLDRRRAANPRTAT